MKKTSINCLSGLFVLVLLPAQSTFGDAAERMKQADNYCRAARYVQAEQAYERAIAEVDPNKSQDLEIAFGARRKLPLVYLALGRPAQAQTAVSDLLIRYAQHEQLPHALHEIVEQASTLGKARQAGRLYEGILTAEPGHPQGIWLKTGVAIANAYAGDDQAVQAAVKDVIAQYNGDPRSAEVLAQIGWAYDKLNQYDKARPLYEYVVDHWPDKPRVIHAHAALVCGCISLKDTQAAQTRLDQLTRRYGRDPELPGVLNDIARACREANLYEQAKAISQRILDSYPGTGSCIWAQRDIVLCDIALRNQEAASAGLGKLVKDYAQDGNLAYVLNEIARTYRQAGMYEQAKPISQHILSNYSGHDQCIWAQRDLILCDIAQHDSQATQAGLEKLVNNYARHGSLPYVLNEISGEYRRLRMYEQAKTVSKYVLDHYGESDQCLWAQRDIILSTLAMKDFPSAAAGVKDLQDKFATQPGAIWAVNEIADTCSTVGQHEQARALFQFSLANCPNPDDAIWSLRGFVNESLALKDEATIDAGITRLLSEYAASRNFPMAAVHIGRTLNRCGHARASEVFQHVIDRHPDHEQAVLARVCIGHIYLQQGRDSQAEAVYQKIVANQASSPELVEAISLMAEGYYELAFRQDRQQQEDTQPRGQRQLSEAAKVRIQKAIANWDTVIDQLPAHPQVTPMSCYYAATAHYQLGDYLKAMQYCTKMLERWPDHEQAWRAHMLIHKISKRQMGEGTMPQPQALATMTESFQQLLQKKPPSPVASVAHSWLQRNSVDREGTAGESDTPSAMAELLKQMLQKYPASAISPAAANWLQQHDTSNEGGEQ